MFTIEVRKNEKNGNFRFYEVRKSARVTHDDCFGGETKWGIVEHDDSAGSWTFNCKRCDNNSWLHRNDIENACISIVKTSIDGEERNIAKDIRVILKT